MPKNVRGEPVRRSQRRSRRPEPLATTAMSDLHLWPECPLARLHRAVLSRASRRSQSRLHRDRASHVPGAARRAALMPELVLLSVDRQVFRDTYRAAASGDEAALRDIEELWRDYDRVEIECFLCGAACPPGPGAMALPER